MAKGMLASGDFKNILIVTSNKMASTDWKLSAEKNNIPQWINYVLFGDGASAFVLRGTNRPSEVALQTKNNICFELLDVNSITDTSFFIFQSYTRKGSDSSKPLQQTGVFVR